MPAVTPARGPETSALVATSCGTAVAAVCAVGLMKIDRLLGGVWSLAALLVGGLCCALLARAFARLAAVVPSGASLLAYVSRGFGRPAGIAIAAPYLLLTLLLVGAEATIVGLIIVRLVPVPLAVAALAFLVGTWLVCRAGVRIGNRAQAVATWALLGGLGALALVPMGAAAARGELVTRLIPPPPTLAHFVAGVGQSLFLFMGFELITAQVELTSAAAVGRAMRRSVTILVAFYGLVALGFSCLRDVPRELGGTFVPQLALAEEAGGAVALALVAVLTLLASFTSINGALLSLSRFVYALAAQGVLPGRLARVEPRTLVPRGALLVLLAVAVSASLLVIFGGMLEVSILAATVTASLMYAAAAWARERAPFAEPARGRLARLAGLGVALVFAAVGAGVVSEAGSARAWTLTVLIVAYGAALAGSVRVARRTWKPAAAALRRTHAHAD